MTGITAKRNSVSAHKTATHCGLTLTAAIRHISTTAGGPSAAIPDTVIRIGSACFRNTNLEAVIIPDSVKTLGTSLFEECDNLYAVKIGAGVRTIPYACFYGCDVLQNVIIPETVLDMETSVFERSGLSYQKLPQSLRYIAGWTFKDCKNLTTVECSDALESIGDNAFERPS